jgi:CrcB protein
VLTAAVVGLAGGAGALLRHLVDGALQERPERLRAGYAPLPLGTLVVNVTGCLVMGAVTGLFWYHGLPGRWRSVVGTGLCGGLTTWSTATWETVQLASLGRPGRAALYAAGSLALAVGAAAAGIALAGAL